MSKLKIGNIVLFARGRCNRRSKPMLGFVDDVLTEDWVMVVSNSGRYKVRAKDCLALLPLVNNTLDEKRS